MSETPETLHPDLPEDTKSHEHALSLGQLRKIATALNEKVKDQVCELCKTDDWSVGHYLVSPVVLPLEKRGLGMDLRQASPHATITCKNCGNTKFLQLNYLGIDPNTGSCRMSGFKLDQAPQTMVSLPHEHLCHYITDAELEAVSKMKDHFISQVCLAATGAFFGAVVPAITGFTHFKNIDNPMDLTDLASILLATLSFGVAVITGIIWRRKASGVENPLEAIRARAKVPLRLVD